jgi:hypothetical protein
MSPTLATLPPPAELHRRLHHAELWMQAVNKGLAPNSRPNAETALNTYFDLVEQIVAVSSVLGYTRHYVPFRNPHPRRTPLFGTGLGALLGWRKKRLAKRSPEQTKAAEFRERLYELAMKQAGEDKEQKDVP